MPEKRAENRFNLPHSLRPLRQVAPLAGSLALFVSCGIPMPGEGPQAKPTRGPTSGSLVEASQGSRGSSPPATSEPYNSPVNFPIYMNYNGETFLVARIRSGSAGNRTDADCYSVYMDIKGGIKRWLDPCVDSIRGAIEKAKEIKAENQ